MQIIHTDPLTSPKKVMIVPVEEGHPLPAFVHDNFPAAVFSGKGNTRYVYVTDEISYLLLGLGSSPQYDTIVKAYRTVLHFHDELCCNGLTLWFSATSADALVQAAFQGLYLGTYRLGRFKSNGSKNFPAPESVHFLGEVRHLGPAQKGIDIAKAQITAMQWVDLPPNMLTPERWAKDVVELFENNQQVKVQIFDEKKSKAVGLDAFLSVGRGSSKSPRFIVVDYVPPLCHYHAGLVGKGITFDTGGLNIKTQGMVHMKCDMAGGAAVMAAMQLISTLQLPVRVTAIVPACENAINSNAYLPSDVISSFSGKTIEIMDTDAEGRLILADGISYMLKEFKPDVLLDIATLTGSSVATFGYECGALFSNNEALAEQLQQKGKEIGEKLWQLPLWDDYKSDIESEVADVKNYSGKPIAGAITAAKFLEYFTENHPAWAHMDIAGVAFGEDAFAKTKHATAFGVHLLTNFIENYTHGKRN
jgi:leucyl aminopeptidase